jgi:activator of 2-hydroxyglutaryl-CoA dehydratase
VAEACKFKTGVLYYYLLLKGRMVFGVFFMLFYLLDEKWEKKKREKIYNFLHLFICEGHALSRMSRTQISAKKQFTVKTVKTKNKKQTKTNKTKMCTAQKNRKEKKQPAKRKMLLDAT